LDPVTAQEFALLRKFVFPERTIVQIEAAARATLSSSSSSSLAHDEQYQDGQFVLDKEWDVWADLTQDSSIPKVVSDQWKVPTDYVLPTGAFDTAA
jgi:hypothetical protein